MAEDFALSFDEEKNKINLAVAELTAKTAIQLKAEQDRVGISSNSGNLKKINIRYTKKAGLVHRIRFKFRKYGVYIEKGASRGHAGSKGSKWKNKKGEEIRTNPKSFNKMNTGNRPAKEWFNPVIENYVEQLTVKVMHEFLELSLKKLRIK